MEQRHVLLLITVVALTLALFVVDVQVPLGVAIWLPYVAVVLLSLWLPGRRYPYLITAACSALTIAGLFLSPPGGAIWTAVVNRLLAIVAFWVTAVVGLAARRSGELERTNTVLKKEMQTRARLEAQLLCTQRLNSIGILAGGIAHDFNNLLTPILMAVKLLKEDRSEEERQRLLKIMQASSERGAEIVRQLLAFAGGTGGERGTVQPRHILKEVQTILEHTFPKTIQIRLELADDLRPVHADATQLAQVLMNLCVNARDAMPRGGTLTLQAGNVCLNKEEARLHPDARPGSYVLLAVSDTGTGIPTDILDKVFDPFFTTKGPGRGTGLGLSTALGIVRNHGGFINVSSAVGQGSQFAVYLPALPAIETRQPEQQRQHLSSGQGELILVVDDEPFILETAQATLEGHGYRVLTATDGTQAVDLFRGRRGEVQAILLDMMMPGMDGPTALATVAALDAKVRIIASSGHRMRGWEEQVCATGRGAWLSKPYTAEQLLTTLAQVLSEGKGER
jgi:signal transduction histidine kinase/ActR/RegA family two-component response regulator